MTRSGLAAATLAANGANGQSAGLLQSWNLPPSSSSGSFALVLPGALDLAALRRQPVSPKAAIDVSVVLGSGSGEPSRLAEVAPDGINSSQTRTGNAASGRARAVIGCGAPSMVTAAQSVAPESTARATA